jgi:hypothetical protein
MNAEDATIKESRERSRQFADLELTRMDRIRENHRREAENIILSILIENEMIEETLAAQARDVEKARKLEEEQRLHARQEHERQAQRQRELEEQAKEAAKEAAKRLQEDLARDEEFRRKKAEFDKSRHEYFAKLEQERIRKNEEARKAALEFEEKRRRDYALQARQLEERERQWNERRRKEQLEREEQNRQEEQRKAAQVAMVKNAQEAHLAQMRQATQAKMDKQQEMLEKLREKQERERAAQAEREAEEDKANRERRERQFAELEEKKRRQWLEHEQRAREYRQKKLGEGDHARREGAIDSVIRHEERVSMSQRLWKRKEAEICEGQRLYEARMRLIEQKEQIKAQMRLEAQIRRNQLEREKYQLETGLMTPAELKRTGLGKLQALAKQLGIDLEALKIKAKQTRRGQSELGERSALPPVRPATVGT